MGIQYKFSESMDKISSNPFSNHSDVLRVTWLFHIKSNNAWIWNAILTWDAPELVYAYGDLQRASDFLQNLSSHIVREVAYILTLNEQNGIFRVMRRGTSISGTPQSDTQPILQSDTKQIMNYYKKQCDEICKELQQIKEQSNAIKGLVHSYKQILEENQRKFAAINRKIRELEHKIDRFEREKNEIEEDGEDDDEQRQFVTNLDGNIEDEQSSINSLFAEIEPLQNEKLDKVSQCAQIKKALTTIENQLCDAQRSLNLKQEKFQTMTQNMMMQKRKIDKAPKYFEEKENELKKKQKEFEQETERINALKVDAQSCGEAISKEEYPRNGRGRRCSLNELTRMRKNLKRRF